MPILSVSAEFLICTVMTTCDCCAQVDVLDVDVNVVIEADLHLFSVIVIQLGTVPAQYVFVVFVLLFSINLPSSGILKLELHKDQIYKDYILNTLIVIYHSSYSPWNALEFKT